MILATDRWAIKVASQLGFSENAQIVSNKNFVVSLKRRFYMLRPKIFILISVFFILISPALYAADFLFEGLQEDSALCPYMSKNLCYSVTMVGPIREADTEALKSIINQRAKVAGLTLRLGYIYLDSEGGDVYEAIKLGRLLRENKAQVLVGINKKCYSACVLVLAGGVARLPMGDVGIHSFYSLASTKKGFNYTAEEQVYKGVAQDIEQYLKDMRVPVRLLDEMINTPSSTMRVLSSDEQVSLSLFGWDPIFHQYLVSNGYVVGE